MPHLGTKDYAVTQRQQCTRTKKVVLRERKVCSGGGFQTCQRSSALLLGWVERHRLASDCVYWSTQAQRCELIKLVFNVPTDKLKLGTSSYMTTTLVMCTSRTEPAFPSSMPCWRQKTTCLLCKKKTSVVCFITSAVRRSTTIAWTLGVPLDYSQSTAAGRLLSAIVYHSHFAYLQSSFSPTRAQSNSK